MRIFLHAGANKTGSTAIQETCTAHRAILNQAGVCYPHIGEKTNHSVLLPAILDDEEYHGNFNRGSPEARRVGVNKSELSWVKLKKIVAKNSPKSLLLSSEFILGLRPQSFERLLERLKFFSDDILVIVYIRDPCDHYLSSAQQILKYGSMVKDPRIIQNYTKKLHMMERFLPGKIRCKKFSRHTLFQNDITIDLLSEILSESILESLRILPILTNESISAEAMALLKAFNLNVWGQRRLVGNPTNKALLQAISAEEARGKYTKPALHSSFREALMRYNVEDMIRLRDDFGLSFNSFDYGAKPIEERADPAPLAQLEVKDIVTYDCGLQSLLTYAAMARLANSKNFKRQHEIAPNPHLSVKGALFRFFSGRVE